MITVLFTEERGIECYANQNLAIYRSEFCERKPYLRYATTIKDLEKSGLVLVDLEIGDPLIGGIVYVEIDADFSVYISHSENRIAVPLFGGKLISKEEFEMRQTENADEFGWQLEG